MEPMRLNDPMSLAIGLGLAAVVVAGLLLGLLWVRRLTSVESEAHVFHSTAPADRPWRLYAIGAGVLLLAFAILLWNLLIQHS